MEHSFDVDVAVKYGVNAAILLQNLYWWIQKNRANKLHYHDGTYWTYNSREAYTKLFPYLSERQVKTAMDKLIADGIVITGDYNTNRYKRPTWYAITNKGYTLIQKCPTVDTEMSERRDKSEPSNTDISADVSANNISRKSADGDFSAGFMEFWKLYPRKVAKPTAHRAWLKTGADDSKALKDSIIADIRRRVNGEWNDKDVQYIPHPSTYLNQRRWEDEPPKPEPEKPRHLYSENLSPEELMRRQKEQAEKDREEARRQGLL